MEAGLCCFVASTTPSTFAAAGFTIFSAILPKIKHAKFPALSIKATPDDLLFPIASFSYLTSRTVGVGPVSASVSSTSSLANAEKVIGYDQRHWMVLMETPPEEITAKPQVVDYYVNTLESVLSCKKDAQKCMYDASWDTHFGFCCDIDEETANELAGMPRVLSVKPDPDFNSVKKDYSCQSIEFKSQSGHFCGSTSLFPVGTTKRWLVRTDRPTIGAIRKAQVVDYYVQVLMRVLGNEKDAQMCMYHVSWQSDYGFCCELDDECAHELAGMPGILSIQPDDNFGSDDKDYGGDSRAIKDSSASTLTGNIKTKKLFVTGLSFYTSEKTLSAAFEGFGELVEVKVIMDKISKRSKGYAFVEYTTEKAATTALREMNGKIINGWMITVDVAKTSPPKYGRRLPKPTS